MSNNDIQLSYWEHPSWMLQELLEEQNLTVETFASQGNLEVTLVKDYLAGTICTTKAIAEGMEQVFKLPAYLPMKMQEAYDAYLAKIKKAAE